LEESMGDHEMHVRVIDEKVTALSNALAELGKGTSLSELITVIRFLGYTTPAEFAFTLAIVDSMAAHVSALAKLEQDLLAASRQVIEQGQMAA
jgi:hypothetical protein